jgi:hypothetical protein
LRVNQDEKMPPDLTAGRALQRRAFFNVVGTGFHADEEPQLLIAAHQRLQPGEYCRALDNRLDRTARRRPTPIGAMHMVDAIVFQDAFHRAHVILVDPELSATAHLACG